MLQFTIKRFENLTLNELYALLRLRSEVFVVEQDCVYQDLDNKDQKALHVLGFKNGQIVAYTRLFDAGAYFDMASIGRVVVHKNERKHGYGQELMKFSIQAISDHFDPQIIKISAQVHLQKFYNRLGFKEDGASYLEDGIPHVAMLKT